jgi:hypothetical protein
MSPFKSMETRGLLSPKKRPALEHFCAAMAENLAELVRQISPKITPRDVSELTLLTLGAQLYGSNNNAIGRQATIDVFLSVIEIVKAFIVSQDSSKINVSNASERKVIIALSSDPDIRIQEEFEGKLRNILAVEIKGGTDASNGTPATPTTAPAKPRNRTGKPRSRTFGIIGRLFPWQALTEARCNKSRRRPTRGSMSLKCWRARATTGKSSEAGSLALSGFRCHN